ncbi:MAG: pyruvate dehydrogenase (acetyl-transferring) E1 component subunit alpha [Spirochaetales bacterium]|nr:pyruvate dehydrogenase (acetyl-transferring) E1 component subunit alpha [Spirochaetales bacterium]MCF7939433.1 pyruvate dehydrogenase (acetyl-transferring) E1 component subunit alpha [Spirochaetales bacterium]
MKKITDYKKDFLLGLLEEMTLIRRFEEKAAQMYGLRKIGGFCHLYNGEEAVAVGTAAALDMKKDYLLTGYRDHGHALATGMDPRGIMAELYGKVTGVSRGKGGSMHMFDVDKHMYGGNGIVGGQIPMATGVAFAQRYREDGGVTVGFFGDGAIHQGAFHESLNLASIWNLPVVYVCENNQFGMGTNFRRVSSVDDFSVMGASYGIPGEQVDGMDVLAVYEAITKAAERARTEGTATLLEAKTYRYKGHSMSDPAKYRTREELESYKQQDPIVMLLEKMKDAGLIDDEAYGKIDDKAKERVEDAAKFAEESEEPALSTIYEDILAE